MTQRHIVWLGVGALVAALVAANAHLAYVAFASAPACVAHGRVGDALAGFAAARSSC